jgi:hypothetical protein
MIGKERVQGLNNLALRQRKQFIYLMRKTP